MSTQKRKKFTIVTTPEKTHPQQPFIQVEGKLTEAQLEAIAGASLGGGWGGNHNETMVSIAELNGRSSISTQSERLTR